MPILVIILFFHVCFVFSQHKPSIIMEFDKTDTVDYNKFTDYGNKISFRYSWRRSYNGTKEWFYHKKESFESKKVDPKKLKILTKEQANAFTEQIALSLVRKSNQSEQSKREVIKNIRRHYLDLNKLYSKIYVYSITDSILYEVKRSTRPNKSAKSIINDMRRLKRLKARKKKKTTKE